MLVEEGVLGVGGLLGLKSEVLKNLYHYPLQIESFCQAFLPHLSPTLKMLL